MADPVASKVGKSLSRIAIPPQLIGGLPSPAIMNEKLASHKKS
jgi:hypothetical protein